MNAARIAAIALIGAGVVGLVYSTCSYTRETHQVALGPFTLTLKERRTVNLPVWLGISAVVIGGALLLFGARPQL